MANGYDTLKGLLNASKTSTSTPTTATKSGYDTLKELLAKQKAAPKTSAAKADTTGYTALLTEINKPKMQATSKKSLFETFRESEQADKTAADAQAAKAPVLKADTLVSRLEKQQIENTGAITPFERAGLAAKSGVQSAGSGALGAFQTGAQFLGQKAADLFGTDKYMSDPKNRAFMEKAAQAGVFGQSYYGGEKSVLNADDLKAASEQSMQEAKQGTGKIGGVALDVIGTGANMGASAALAAASGIPYLAGIGTTAGGSAALQAKEQGKTIEQQTAYGLTSGLSEAAIESISGIGASKALKAAAAKGASALLAKLPSGVASWLSKAGTSTAAKILGDAVGEATEEAVQYDVDRVLQKITLGNDVPRDIKEQAYQALIGGVTGGIFGGANAIAGTLGKAQTQATTPVQTAAEAAQAQTAPATPAEVQTAQKATPAAPKTTLDLMLEDVQQREHAKQTAAPKQSLLEKEILKQSGAKETSDGTGVGAMNNPFTSEQKVSEVYTNTLKNTDLLNDIQKAQLDERDYVFDSVSEKESVAKAKQRLDVDFDGEVADLSAMPAYTAAEDVDTAMGILGAFAKDSEAKNDFTSMKQWSKDLYQKIHQSATTLQAMDKYSRTPEGAVIKAQQAIFNAEKKLTTKNELGKTVQNSIGKKISSDVETVTKIINALSKGENITGMGKELNKVKVKDIKELFVSGAYDADSINDLVRSKYGIPTLTAADVQKIYELTKMANETTDDYQRRAYTNRAVHVIADKMPVSFKNKVLAVRRIAMLLNPKTVISRNAGGNVVFGLLEDIKDAPGTLIDIAVSKKTGIRTTSYNPLATTKAELSGMKKGITEWARDIKEGVDTSPTEHEMPRSTALKSKLGAGVEKALYNLLALGDRPFFEGAYAKRIDEFKRLGLDYTSADAQVEATAYALERVFQNDSALAQKAMQLRESLGILGDIAIPFAQTPANIFDKLADYSPYGFVRAIKKAGSIGDSAWSQKQFVDTLSRSITGTGLITLGAVLAANGLITGGEKDEEDEAVTYQKKISGWQPYSIVVGDKSYTYDWANPVGTLLALGADASQSKSAKEHISAIAMAGLKAGINTMFNQSYMEGLSEIFGQDDIASGFETMLIGLPSSFTPTAFQQMARIIDPIARDTYDTDPFKRSWNKVKAKLPWASATLPAKVSASGQETTNFQGSIPANVFESFISPGYIGETQRTKVDEEVTRLYDITGDASVLPEWSEYTSKGDLSFTVDGIKYTMNASEWEKYQKTRGQEAYKTIAAVIARKEYKSLSDAEKAELVTDALEAATRAARRETLKARGKPYPVKDKVFEATTSGFTVDEYLAYMAKINSYGGTSLTQDEVQYVIDNQLKLPKDKASKLWKIINSSWKTNPYK